MGNAFDGKRLTILFFRLYYAYTLAFSYQVRRRVSFSCRVDVTINRCRLRPELAHGVSNMAYYRRPVVAPSATGGFNRILGLEETFSSLGLACSPCVGRSATRCAVSSKGINVDDETRVLLMVSANSGAALVQQGYRSTSWRTGQTVPIARAADTRIEFDSEFTQLALSIEMGRLENMCAQWLGHPLERPIQFALEPCSPAFETVWQDSMQLMATLGGVEMPISEVALASLYEFLLSSLLHGHLHNFSEQLAMPVSPAAPCLISAAEQLFRERARSTATVADVARELGVSIRSLQAGFRESRQITPTAFLRQIRLEAAHRSLTQGAPSTSVTDVALESGFTHVGRFCAAYKAAFGETPVITLRRNRTRNAET